MGKTYETIDQRISEFISEQQMFFVATAPLSSQGNINLSPKGLDSFRVLDETTVVYADFVGSGIETVAHLKENGRIVIMFCSFMGAPKIVRLHGHGEVIEEGQSQFLDLRELFPPLTGLRCFIRVRCDRVSDSCGFGVPLYDFVAHRSQLTEWAKRKRMNGLDEYVEKNNTHSIDGLVGLQAKTEDE